MARTRHLLLDHLRRFLKQTKASRQKAGQSATRTLTICKLSKSGQKFRRQQPLFLLLILFLSGLLIVVSLPGFASQPFASPLSSAPSSLAEIPPTRTAIATNKGSNKENSPLLQGGRGGSAPAQLVVRKNSLLAANTLMPEALSQAESLEQQARSLYDVGRFAEAVQVLQQALQNYQAQGDAVGQAVILSNLSLSYQQLGAWKEATAAVESAFALLQKVPNSTADRAAVWAQTLDVQGNLQLARGETDKAFETWGQAASLYTQLGDVSRATLSRINQAQALQALGLYRRAIIALTELQQTLKAQPASLTTAVNLRSLGDALRAIGNLDQAREVLGQSLKVAADLQARRPAVQPEVQEFIATAHLTLGNIARSQGKTDEALRLYQQAATESAVVATQVQAHLNHLRLLVELQRWQAAERLYPQIQAQIASLPPGRSAIYAQANLARNMRRLSGRSNRTGVLTMPSAEAIAQVLAVARQQAEDLGDVRSQAQVLKELGRLYEQTRQWPFAKELTQQALSLSQSIDAKEISYVLEWQLGRILCQGNQPCAAGNIEEPIAAYTEAFNTLQALRNDLVSASSDVQFSFRESVEPIYRQLVDLLLQPAEPSQKNLRQARDVLEALQVAELENFFQQACQDITLQLDKVIDQGDPTAAVIYPIILDDRLEVVLKLPGQPDLYNYPAVKLARSQVESTLKVFRRNLQDEYRFKAVQKSGQIVYDWLIKPVSDRLEKSGIKTLIFVLDGPLRTIPMSALYDGTQYLVEKYAVTLVLGLEVRDPVPLHREKLRVLAASLTEPPKGYEQYARLANVNPELDAIQKAGVSVSFIRDSAFTRAAFNKELNQDSFQVVHLATHGQFGSDKNTTYLLAADGAIQVDDLDELFRNRRGIRTDAVELLILSACKTAAGNDRAILGIAGTTVRAGARSAIAGLWSLADAPSVKFTQTLYQFLGKPGVSRAEALRQAQQALLNDPQFNHPRYWAPYVLVGSWL
jgi:CHAT domain-containing protein